MSVKWGMRISEDELRDAIEKSGNADLQKFVEDIDNAALSSKHHNIELTIEHYSGRNMWHGPAVRVDDPSIVQALTTVRTQFDRLGHGYIVYPIARLPYAG